jgi:tight adherence protein C
MDFLFNIVFSIYAFWLTAFGSVFILVLNVMPDESKILAQKRLGMESEQKVYRFKLLQYASYGFPIVLPTIQVLKLDRFRAKRNQILVASALRDQMDADEFYAFKVIFCFLFCLGSLYFYGINSPEISPFKIAMFTVAGFFVPNIWVSGILKKRHKEIFRTLPYFMDMLTLSVEAGLDFVASITRIIQKCKPTALVDEFQIMLKEIKLGTNRSDALGNMARRIQLSEFSSMTTVLVQADQLGASIGPVLRAQSDLLRTQRFQKAEKKGAEASQKILIPMIGLILPTIAIVIFGPMAMKYFYGGV